MRTNEEIIELIKSRETLPAWVSEARAKNKELNALVYGKDFHELLINNIEKIESADRAKARKKYSIDVRDLFSRVMEPRQNVFSADGAAEYWSDEVPNATKTEIKEVLQDFKGGKSIDEYLAKYLFRFSDVDPNGLIFLEYKTNERGELQKVYPTYKCIQDVQDYDSDGLMVKWVLFSPMTKNNKKYWRYVDEARDVIIEDNNGFKIVEEFDKINDFGVVPAVILSDVEEIGTQKRLSWLFFIEELSKKYARDRSVKTLYEFLQGFPKHWRYDSFDNSRRNLQRDNSDSPTDKSNERGQSMKPDVTDDIVLPPPVDKEYDAIIAPNIAGYISPDLETLKHMGEEGKHLEQIIEFTMWGTHKSKEGGNETATGRFIDVQPLQNKLHVFADFAQNVHNLLAYYVAKLMYRQEVEGNEIMGIYMKSYGRRFIIEGPDVLLDKYNEARKSGAPSVILDRILNEWISSKYKHSPEMRRKETLKSQVEPYVHMSIEQVFQAFGVNGVERKELFNFWWMNFADKDLKTAEQLKNEFAEYTKDLLTQKTNTNE